MKKKNIILKLAEDPDAMLNLNALASALEVSPITVKRMVRRGELPPSISLGVRKVWIAQRVMSFLTNRAERAEKEAERENHRDRARTRRR